MSRLSVIAVICLIAVTGACVSTPDADPATEANKRVVRECLDLLVNQGDMSAWPDLIAGETLTFNGQAMSQEQVATMRATLRTILPDMLVTIEEQIAEGDVVASRVTITGTHLGDYMELKASGKELSFGGIAYDRLRDGKIVEAWHQMDIWGTLLAASDD